MKTSFWDILSIFIIIGVVIAAAFMLLLFTNPGSALNPFPPATPAPTIFVPSATPTSGSLPPTWTPTVGNTGSQATFVTRSTSTPIPTRTPFVLPSPTDSPALVMPTNVRNPPEGRCKVTQQDPVDGTRVKIGTEFRASWTLQNTSDVSWGSDEADVRFADGVAMQTGPSVIDLYETVPAGSSTLITITMKVPEKVGYHIAYWSVAAGSKSLCTFYIEIFAEE